MIIEDVERIAARSVKLWNAEGQPFPLWVVLAAPGDSLAIPGVTFGSMGNPIAGMELPVRAHLIVLNKSMKPESLLSTFFHELGHARYRLSHEGTFQPIDSEVAAILNSLESLAAEGLPHLAKQEAQAILEMSVDEPYRSAVAKLSSHPVWLEYLPR